MISGLTPQLTSSMRRHIAHFIGPLLGRIPIRQWPGFLAQLTGVLLPRATVPHETVKGSGGANIGILLDFLDKTSSLEGDVAECGVWRGRSRIAMEIYLRQIRSAKTLWGSTRFRVSSRGRHMTSRTHPADWLNKRRLFFDCPTFV